MYMRSKERGEQLAKIIARRMAMLVLVMLGVSIVTFFVARVIPGDPALLIAGPRATPETVSYTHLRAHET
jgi:ABC-type dipeptide/oligopeptide/nickel transport system permease component